MINGKLFTIGHGNRSTEELLTLLHRSEIQILVDIRSNPYSRRFPHFSQESLRKSIDDAGLTYHWAGRQLGGLRKPTDENLHISLSNESMKGFAEYMEQDVFEKAIIQLLNLSTKGPTAILCAEKLASSCHRSLIADFLTLKNYQVFHILDEDTILAHSLSELARTESAKLIYDRQVNQELKLH